MGTCRFGRYELLTTEVPKARAFYEAVFGQEFWGPDITLGALPERALALGARPHFRPQLAVPDLQRTLASLVAAGGQQLGPLLPGPDGSARAGLRDPFGAILALSSESMPASRGRVAWHLMASLDHAKAFALYAELCGWQPLQALDLGERGRHQTFGWAAASAAVGSFSDVARTPSVHPQWLCFFHVPDIAQAAAAVKAQGGLALPIAQAPDGAQVAACDDAQGAAFGLYQSARSASPSS